MYLGGGYSPVSLDQQEKWIDELMDLSGTNRRFIISNNENNEPVGLVGLYNINWIHRFCEIGLYIGDEDARGKGFATEAGRLIEKYAQDYLNLRKIKLSVVADNIAALKLWQARFL